MQRTMRRKRLEGLLVACVLLEVLIKFGRNSWLGVVGIGLVLVGLWVFDRRLTKHRSAHATPVKGEPELALEGVAPLSAAHPEHQEIQDVSFGFSVVTGLIFGVVVLGLAYVFIFYGPPDLQADHVGVPSLVVMYLLGGLIGGVIYWLTQPLMARGHAGRGLVGFLCTAPLWVAVALSTVPGTMATPRVRTVMGLVFAVFMGGGFFMVDR